MLLVGNGQVITRNPEQPYLKDGAVLIDGEEIRKVGPFEELKKSIRMQNLWMPGAELLCRA